MFMKLRSVKILESGCLSTTSHHLQVLYFITKEMGVISSGIIHEQVVNIMSSFLCEIAFTNQFYIGNLLFSQAIEDSSSIRIVRSESCSQLEQSNQGFVHNKNDRVKDLVINSEAIHL